MLIFIVIDVPSARFMGNHHGIEMPLGGGIHRISSELVRTALPEEAKDKPLEVWFQDEARVGQQGTLALLWARKGMRPRAPKDCRCAWAYIFGAVCPARATGAALVMAYANTDAMSDHLAAIARHVSPGAHAILVVDGASWHRSACCEAWNALNAIQERVASISARDWAKVSG